MICLSTVYPSLDARPSIKVKTLRGMKGPFVFNAAVYAIIFLGSADSSYRFSPKMIAKSVNLCVLSATLFFATHASGPHYKGPGVFVWLHFKHQLSTRESIDSFGVSFIALESKRLSERNNWLNVDEIQQFQTLIQYFVSGS